MEHTAQNISNFIKETIREWGLEKFVPFVIITDNGANVVAGVRLSGQIGVRCSSHSFDLVLDELLNGNTSYNKIVLKSRNISSKFRNNRELAQLFEDVQNEMYGDSLSLIGRVETRFFLIIFKWRDCIR